MYDFSVPIFIKHLGAMRHLLDKAEALSKTVEGGEQGVLVARLAPDMFPFVKQVQVMTDNAKGAAARLAGVEVPVMEDTETTFEALRVRIDKTIDFLKTLMPEQFADAATRKIELGYFPGKHFLGDAYLTTYALPNFFFHATTAYGILRMLGSDIGKADFMNGLPLISNE